MKDKTKGFFALGSIVIVLLWMALWYVFPIDFYAVFFNNTVGSYIQLALLAIVLSFPMCFIFSKLTKNDIPIFKTLIANIVCLVALDFIYSVFYFEHFIFVILTSVVHLGIMIWIFGFAKSKVPNSKLYAPIKRQPLKTIVWAVLYTVIIDAADIMLFRLITSIYYK